MRRTWHVALFVFLLVGGLFAPLAHAQFTPPLVRTPAVSPRGQVAEEVGKTWIEVDYGRPAVNGREIWGALVPYNGGTPFPWRAGANENTTVSFEDDMLVEGQPLAAGTYGLHMIPSAGTWTIIFNRDADAWGSFNYDPSRDALRVTVTPEAADHAERLTYVFDNHTDFDKVTLALHWAQKRVPIRLQVADVHGTVLAAYRSQMRNLQGFGTQIYQEAAQYALANNVASEEALGWIDRVIQNNPTFAARTIKVDLLARAGQREEAAALQADLIEGASENELNAYGYQLVNQGRHDEAMRIFKLNVERHPDAWNPHDSLGEAYARAGDMTNARKYYQMALEKLPETDAQNHQRITGILANLDS